MNTFSHYPHVDSSTESENVSSPRRRRAKEENLFILQREKSKWKQVQVEMDERFRACLVLAASGDAIGFHSGEWETCTEGEEILQEVQLMGGLEAFNIGGWEVSDDTVMLLAVARALASEWESIEDLCKEIAKKLTESVREVEMRICSPEPLGTILKLARGYSWENFPFSPTDSSSGGTCRALSLGLYFKGKDMREQLVAATIESCRMTHNHPIAFLGAFTAGLFTSFALEDIAVKDWGSCLIDALNRHVYPYLQKRRQWKEYQKELFLFEGKWRRYLKKRGLQFSSNDPIFPLEWTSRERDIFYRGLSLEGVGGASGDDATIIAYDSLLAAGSDWESLVTFAALHGGKSDTTGCLAAGWWGVLHGFEGVPKGHFAGVEYREELEQVANRLFRMATTDIKLSLARVLPIPKDVSLALPLEEGQVVTVLSSPEHGRRRVEVDGKIEWCPDRYLTLIDFFEVEALGDFRAEKRGDLSFRKGEIVQILQMRHDNWWLGQHGGTSGWLPSNFVRLLE